MKFGSYFLSGPLFDEATDGGNGGGGGGTPLTVEALKGLLEANNAAMRADFQKQQEDERKARKAEEDRKAAEDADRRKAEETERQRLEEEKRATEGGADKRTAYELKKLQDQVADERKKREAAETAQRQRELEMAEKDRVSSIRSSLSAFQFAKPGAAETAFRHVRDEIKADNDGRLIGPNGAPLMDYLNDLFKQGGELELLLAPKASGGSGAQASRTGAQGAIDMDTIKPGANNEAARAEISRLVSDALNRR